MNSKARNKFISLVKKVEHTVKRNSECRRRYGLKSCAACEMYDDCMANGFNEIVAKKNKASKNVFDSWKLEEKIRKSC